MSPKEFERLDRLEMLAALRYAGDVYGVDSETYRALANKHGWSHLTGGH